MVGGGKMPNSKGNRRPDDWLGMLFRSRVSAVRHLVRVFRFGCRKVPYPYLVLIT